MAAPADKPTTDEPTGDQIADAYSLLAAHGIGRNRSDAAPLAMDALTLGAASTLHLLGMLANYRDSTLGRTRYYFTDAMDTYLNTGKKQPA